jgi:LL-diaminopimelate aminotransferase
MIRINEHFNKLQASYLFVDINKRIEAHTSQNPEADLIKLGIGDVTRALPQSVVRAFHDAVDEMGQDDSFRGYGPEQGYPFLREAIVEGDYEPRGVSISPDDIFVSDGSKCDTGNFQELFATDISVAVPDPVYPVYVDSNVMAGRTGPAEDGRYAGLTYLPATAENGFVPSPPAEAVDLIYLCFPNNPTGSVATHEQLKAWVDYARKHKALILFDAAYYGFISDNTLPQSIYEVDGAKEVAVEFRSFSKTAGFTGTRCAFTVIPEECTAYDSAGNPHSVKQLWNRRHSTKFNGVAYPVQRAAQAVYTAQGRREVKELIDFYMENAAIVREFMEKLGYECTGGKHSPYIWIDGKGESSWDLFQKLLSEAEVVTTPGVGFGRGGEGFIRISAFNNRENIETAMKRIERALAPVR